MTETENVPEWAAELIRGLGHTVNVSLQPSEMEPTGELWTVSVAGGHYRLGQGSTLSEALDGVRPFGRIAA